MFEAKIQYAWERYREDWALGRVLILVAAFNLLLFSLSALIMGKFLTITAFPILLSFCFLAFREKLIKQGKHTLILSQVMVIAISIWFNYSSVEDIDQFSGGLERKDLILAQIDQSIFKTSMADYLYLGTLSLGKFQTLLYDILQVSYLGYFILAFAGAYFYYKNLGEKNKYKMGRYFASVIIFFNINFLCYLFFSVTGPQYFLRESFLYTLPLSWFGQFLHGLVQDGQATYIDCFPSGHVGLSVLVTSWMFRIRHACRFAMGILCFLIILATVFLRYHYLIDVIAAFPLCYFSYQLGKLLVPVHIKD